MKFFLPSYLIQESFSRKVQVSAKGRSDIDFKGPSRPYLKTGIFASIQAEGAKLYRLTENAADINVQYLLAIFVSLKSIRMFKLSMGKYVELFSHINYH